MIENKILHTKRLLIENLIEPCEENIVCYEDLYLSEPFSPTII